MLQKHLVRLACIRHAASVHPEPGSNSPQKIFHSCECKLRNIYWIDRVVASYHYSVVKVLVTKRAEFYTSRLGLSRHQQTKTPMSLSFDIGSSDCKTHRLVSLTRDFSVFNDLSGDEICRRMYWRMMIICVCFDLSRGYQTINLKKSGFLFSDELSFTDIFIFIRLAFGTMR